MELHDIELRAASSTCPLELWLRYVPDSTGDERVATLGTLPKKGSVTLDGFVSECSDGCSVQQLYLSGSSLLGLGRLGHA